MKTKKLKLTTDLLNQPEMESVRGGLDKKRVREKEKTKTKIE